MKLKAFLLGLVLVGAAPQVRAEGSFRFVAGVTAIAAGMFDQEYLSVGQSELLVGGGALIASKLVEMSTESDGREKTKKNVMLLAVANGLICVAIAARCSRRVGFILFFSNMLNAIIEYKKCQS